jgi:pyruvate/2-oxoglutarate dehydrogenase complex dihydrolipoamide acyltransferase (E2) component
LAPDGHLDVRLIFDHRVLDGAPVARALGDLQAILRDDIAEELRQIVPAAA